MKCKTVHLQVIETPSLALISLIFCSIISQAVDCGVVKPLLNGSISGEMTVFPHLLRIHCDEGFTLLGSTSRKCQANGTWSGRDAFCKGTCAGICRVNCFKWHKINGIFFRRCLR